MTLWLGLVCFVVDFWVWCFVWFGVCVSCVCVCGFWCFVFCVWLTVILVGVGCDFWCFDDYVI